MKKFFLIWAVLVLAAPAMAVVNVTATQVGTTDEVDIIVTWSGEGTPPRAFALDITVDSGQTITDVTNYHTGESETGNKGYGIFPASFAREINADDPNWADVNYTPVAELGDLPSDTQGGIDTGGVTVELGSLYTGPNVPTSPSTLCTITVSDDCNVCFALNVGRAGIVLEDGNAPSSVSMPCVPVDVEEICIVPDVVDMAEAAAITAIENEGFVAGTPTTQKHDTIVAGNVISTTPSAGAEPGCGTTVAIVTSLGPCVVPNVVDVLEATAITAIETAGFVAGTPTAEKHDTIAAGNVISTTPSAGAEPGCGTTVAIVTSLGPCIVPNVVGDSNAVAQAAIIAEGFAVGNRTAGHDCTVPAGDVISQSPAAGTTPGCGTAVDIVVADGDTIVPNVVNMTRTDANTAIVAAGLVVGVVDYATSGTVPRESVISQNPTDGGATVTCGSAVNYTASSGCFPKAHADYTEWLSVGEPECWCYPRQCHGDIDGLQEAYGKGFVWVGYDDYDILSGATWLKSLGDPALDICADLDHAQEPYGKGYVRVGYNDYDILKATGNWLSNPDPNCP